MSSKCSVLRDITHLLQKVDSLLMHPNILNSSRGVRKLIDKLRLLEGAIRALPINKGRKRDILHRLRETIALLRKGRLSNVSTILAISQILLTIRAKVEDLTIPCPQGLTIVHPSNCFNTTCLCCN